MRSTESARADLRLRALEVAIVAVAGIVAARLLLVDPGPRPFLWAEWSPLGRPLLFALFGLLWLRVRAGKAHREPELIVTGALLLALGLASHPGPSLGADARPFLAQLQGLLFEGRLPVDPLFEPGPALVWLPFYAVAHGLVKAGAVAAPADGWSFPYANAVRAGSLASAFLASLVALRVARRFFPARLAAVAVALAWLATPLLYYTTAEPAMAHAPATLAVAVFLLLWVRAREKPEAPKRWLALAAGSGVLLSMQRYEVIYLVAPVFDVARLAARTAPQRLLRLGLAAAAALTAGLLPLLWMAGLGRGTTWLWQGDLAWNLPYWRDPRVAEVLFASRGGVLAWTPIAGLGLLGLFGFARRERSLGAGLLLAFAAGVVLLGSSRAWAGSWAFGGRRLTEFAPALVLGIAWSLQFLWRRPALLLAAGAAALVAWNVTLIGLVQRGRVPEDAAFSFGDAAADGVRELHDRFGNPAAFPGPWLFAWRHGVAPGRFDMLFGRDARRVWTARIGSAADASLLGRGWSPPLPTGGRAAIAAEATLLVALPQPDACRVRVLSRSDGAAPGTREVALLVNGTLAARLAVPGAAETAVPAAFWREGANEIAFAPGPGDRFHLDAFELHCGAR